MQLRQVFARGSEVLTCETLGTLGVAALDGIDECLVLLEHGRDARCAQLAFGASPRSRLRPLLR